MPDTESNGSQLTHIGSAAKTEIRWCFERELVIAMLIEVAREGGPPYSPRQRALKLFGFGKVFVTSSEATRFAFGVIVLRFGG